MKRTVTMDHLLEIRDALAYCVHNDERCEMPSRFWTKLSHALALFDNMVMPAGYVDLEIIKEQQGELGTAEKKLMDPADWRDMDARR